MENKNVLQAINHGRYLSLLCRIRAAEKKAQFNKIKRAKPATTKIWIERMKKADQLERQIETLENRASNLWNAVTNYQGKYIAWKDVHNINGKTYCGIFELLEAAEQDPTYSKVADLYNKQNAA